MFPRCFHQTLDQLVLVPAEYERQHIWRSQALILQVIASAFHGLPLHRGGDQDWCSTVFEYDGRTQHAHPSGRKAAAHNMCTADQIWYSTLYCQTVAVAVGAPCRAPSLRVQNSKGVY